MLNKILYFRYVVACSNNDIVIVLTQLYIIDTLKSTYNISQGDKYELRDND